MTGVTPSILKRRADDADEDAAAAADQREQHGLEQELGEDRRLGCADGLADPDLAGALGDGDEHDVHHADPADEQRDRRDRAEQRREGARGRLRRR